MKGKLGITKVGCYGLVLLLVLLGLDIVWVLFFGGITLMVGGTAIRSTTLEFPAIAFLVVFVLLLTARGKRNEALLFFGALLVAGLIAEFLLRIIDHPLSKPYVDYTSWYQPSDVLGHELVPGFEGFGPLNVPIKVNSKGFRDVEHRLPKKEDTIRILGLGDSFMFGWGVGAQEIFFKRVEKLLSHAAGTRVETINAGVPGWGLNQYYLYLKKAGVQYSPDLIVLAYFTDDLPASILEAIPANQRYRVGVSYRGGVFHYSRFYNFMKSLADHIRQKNRPGRVEYLHDLETRRAEWAKQSHYLMVSREEQEEKQVALLDTYLTRLNQITEQENATLIVLFIPDVSQLHHPELQHINEVLHNLTRDHGTAFLDMTQIFERAGDPSTYYLWPKDPHLNGLGHLKTAEALVELICGMSGNSQVGAAAKVLPRTCRVAVDMSQVVSGDPSRDPRTVDRPTVELIERIQ